ncbi:MAG: sugar transferase [Syntrophothermus sp.]|uniref:sugar transferase n=1 Tax=Syntrophothermus sp. TaxID=2736299 RepID=UPI00257FF32B|nr:sugar transferase [Syntrophothermus sp.]NSW84040.1 sugar transferase [Syntrophothermus sp.]
MLKRFLDIIVSLVLLILLFPVFVVIAVAVVLDSGFPVFYRGERIGRGGRPFRIIKFRSMYVSSAQGPAITGRDDPRVTRVGKFLRKWKLDELPQFYNVLKGEMSLVGPRPEAPQYVEFYSDDEKKVLSVRPGVTGVSQLLFRNEEEMLEGPDPERFYLDILMRQKLCCDLAYIRNQSLVFDLVLILLTLVAVVFPREPGIKKFLLEKFLKTGVDMNFKNFSVSGG